MRRLVLFLPLLLMPLAAAGQSLSGDTHALAQYLLTKKPDQMAEVQPGVVVPVWRGSNGRWLALKADKDTAPNAQRDNSLAFSVVDASSVMSSELQYGLSPHLQAHAGVVQHNWANSSARIVGSEVGASYGYGRYSLGLSVGADSVPDSAPSLPRILPGVMPGSTVNGLSGFDSSSQVTARGRLALDPQSGIDLGASMGRIHLLPGNLLGLDTVDQKSVSFGVDRGALSGMIVGRTMEPGAGAAGFNADRRWNSIDLGVTWKLPWQGHLSIGAQNVWSSGSATNTPAGPEPNQSRTPYVQYRQDL